METTLQHNFFQFNKKYYRMTDGVLMASALSLFLSNIFMDKVKQKLFDCRINKHLKNIIFWGRNVDDVLCIWDRRNGDIEDLFTLMNNIYDNITFTMEKGLNNSINFLDTTMTLNNDKIEFDI